MMAFASGELVHASLGSLAGEDAVYELLTWEDGEFHVDDSVTNVPAQNINTPWSMLLLDMLHRIDEVRAERDSAAQQVLEESKARGQVRSAIIVTDAGKLRASASDEDPEREVALIALVSTRMQALGEALRLGGFERLVSTRQADKVVVEKVGDTYLGCWLGERGTSDPVKAALENLKNSPSTSG
jgi:hypothetical protein